jgi:hypothetical protein
MAIKAITLIILRADRKLWTGGPVRLQVTDLNVKDPSKGLKVIHDKPLAAGVSTVLINLDLFFNAGQVYGITIDADGHRSAWQLINRQSFIREEGATKIEVDGMTMRLMLVPEKPTSSDLDAGYDLLAAAASPMVADKGGLKKPDYLALEPAEKMALLNIDAKLRETRINGASLLSFVQGLELVAVDRLFLLVRPELKQLVKTSSDFASAPGHKAPTNVTVSLPAHPASWKHTRFGAGNLQLSFAKDSQPLPADTTRQVFSVDADIDLERGLLHVAEFLDNKIHPNKKTNQTLVYALLFSQGIIPNYTLSPV